MLQIPKQGENFEERESHTRACSLKLFSASAEGHPILGMGLSPGFSVQSWESDLLASFLHVFKSTCRTPSIETPSFRFLLLVITLCRDVGPEPRGTPCVLLSPPKSRQRIFPHTNLLSGSPLICMKSLYLLLFVCTCVRACVRASFMSEQQVGELASLKCKGNGDFYLSLSIQLSLMHSAVP